MKKLSAYFMLTLLLLSLCGCGRSMNDIISNQPSVTGTVEEVREGFVTLYAEDAPGYPNGSRWHIQLEVENPDSYLDVAVGDVIEVYYDGAIMESSPLQVETVCAIVLLEPADRSINERP